jgi:CheY-like chemotaxis protein
MTLMTAVRYRILVAEDDPDTRAAVCSILAEHGFDVIEAENGKQALEAMRSSLRPHLVVLDLMMPVMDGVEFLARQRADEELAGTPVIVLTATGMPDVSRLGAPVLAKPVRIQELLSAVRAQMH